MKEVVIVVAKSHKEISLDDKARADLVIVNGVIVKDRNGPTPRKVVWIDTRYAGITKDSPGE